VPPIKPQIESIAQGSGGAFNQLLAGVAFIDTQWTPALPYAITAGNSQDTDPILVSGFNAFMVMVTVTSGGGTFDIAYNINDPSNLTSILTSRSLKAAQAAGNNLLFFFGAFSTPAGNVVDTSADCFVAISLHFHANAATQTVTSLRLWAGVR
jgi:hypothetical protein